MLSICRRHMQMCKVRDCHSFLLSLSLSLHNYLKFVFSIQSPFDFQANNSIRQARSILDLASLFINGLFGPIWCLLYQEEMLFLHKWRDKQQSVDFMQSWKQRSACQFCERVVLSMSSGGLLISSSLENAARLLCKMSKRSTAVLPLSLGILSSLHKYQSYTVKKYVYISVNYLFF